MAELVNGDIVKVFYEGRLDDGSVFDNTFEDNPLEFVIGLGAVLESFEMAVLEMKKGEKKTIKITSEEAYGAKQDDLIKAVKKEDLPDGFDVKAGGLYQLKDPSGKLVIFTVVKKEWGKIIIDANHPLAGKNLEFDIELIGVIKKSDSNESKKNCE